MKTATELLWALRQQGATFDLVGDRLAVRLPASADTLNTRAALHEHKDELLLLAIGEAMLTEPAPVTLTPQERRWESGLARLRRSGYVDCCDCRGRRWVAPGKSCRACNGVGLRKPTAREPQSGRATPTDRPASGDGASADEPAPRPDRDSDGLPLDRWLFIDHPHLLPERDRRVVEAMSDLRRRGLHPPWAVATEPNSVVT
ncbi:MAG: hypothetical protein SF069_02105 [Phycisphaerae bacterium]|nr:hypothetical protein [Phycisphaerae bacterium]